MSSILRRAHWILLGIAVLLIVLFSISGWRQTPRISIPSSVGRGVAPDDPRVVKCKTTPSPDTCAHLPFTFKDYGRNPDENAACASTAATQKDLVHTNHLVVTLSIYYASNCPISGATLSIAGDLASPPGSPALLFSRTSDNQSVNGSLTFTSTQNHWYGYSTPPLFISPTDANPDHKATKACTATFSVALRYPLSLGPLHLWDTNDTVTVPQTCISYSGIPKR